MRTAGLPRRRQLGIAIAIVVIAATAALMLFQSRGTRMASDDASIDADVVHIAAAVGGRITELVVHENDAVKRGDVLLRIDPQPYEQALAIAQANVDVAQATLQGQRRTVATQRSSATIATEQTRRAETNLGLSHRTEQRLHPLTDKGYVARQQLDQAQVAVRDATTSLDQAREQERAARQAVGSTAASEAALRAAEAALASAQSALANTVVRAPHDGRVVGLTISTGEMVAPGQAVFTLINTEEWFVVANLRENELQAIAVGDCATVYSMLDRSKALKGAVQSVGWGILADDRINLPRSVPYVKPSLNWVRVAQRFPVRIVLEDPPANLVRMGASASVEIHHGAACQ